MAAQSNSVVEAPAGDLEHRRGAPGRARPGDTRRSAEGPPLGTTTKYASAVDVETGEIRPERDPYAKWAEQAAARAALPGHRIHVCMRHLRQDRREVEVKQSGQSGRSYFAGVMACGSVWVCPVCARKIQAVRAAEVRAGIEEAMRRGWRPLMLTQTIRHSRADDLAELVGKFSEALRNFRKWRAYSRAVEDHGIEGAIRALEVTWGEVNGWHPHAHTILLVSGPLDGLEDALRSLWARAVESAGLPAGNEHALQLEDASAVQEYLTKMATDSYRWGPEDELVRAHSKRGRGFRFTPFDLLRACLEDDNPRYRALFAQFAWAFHGRRQLVWSNGLKKELLGSDGVSDQQIADSLGEADELLANITLEVWRFIRKRNLQRTVLEVADLHGRDGLRLLLEVYQGRVTELRSQASP